MNKGFKIFQLCMLVLLFAIILAVGIALAMLAVVELRHYGQSGVTDGFGRKLYVLPWFLRVNTKWTVGPIWNIIDMAVGGGIVISLVFIGIKISELRDELRGKDK